MDKHLTTIVLGFFGTVLTSVAIWVGSSVVELNKNVATVIERTFQHERRLERLEARVK